MPKIISNEAWFASRWQRSKRSNLWQRLEDGTVLVVFRRRWVLPYGWSMHDEEDDRTQFSLCGYETEDEAAEAVYDAVFGV